MDQYRSEDIPISQALPEVNLCAAIIRRAIDDYLSPQSEGGDRLRESAAEWLFADDQTPDVLVRWVNGIPPGRLTFLQCCEHVADNGDAVALAEKIRQGLKLQGLASLKSYKPRRKTPGSRPTLKVAIVPGERYGRLKIIGRCQGYSSGTFVQCLCDCGKKVVRLWTMVHRGQTKSCGCWRSDRAGELRKRGPRR